MRIPCTISAVCILAAPPSSLATSACPHSTSSFRRLLSAVRPLPSPALANAALALPGAVFALASAAQTPAGAAFANAGAARTSVNAAFAPACEVPRAQSSRQFANANAAGTTANAALTTASDLPPIQQLNMLSSLSYQPNSPRVSYLRSAAMGRKQQLPRQRNAICSGSLRLILPVRLVPRLFALRKENLIRSHESRQNAAGQVRREVDLHAEFAASQTRIDIGRPLRRTNGHDEASRDQHRGP
jgi:hypothetical protein